jgi:hypothetical protein
MSGLNKILAFLVVDILSRNTHSTDKQKTTLTLSLEGGKLKMRLELPTTLFNKDGHIPKWQNRYWSDTLNLE